MNKILNAPKDIYCPFYYCLISHHVLWRDVTHIAHARHSLSKLLLYGVQGPWSWLKVASQGVVCQVELRRSDVDCYKAADTASHHPVFVENDAGGDDEAGVREVPCVVNGENPTGILVSHTNVILPLLESLSALKAVVRPIRFAALTSLKDENSMTKWSVIHK